jgi:ribosome silencing factor RsfS/YbeB/iojap
MQSKRMRETVYSALTDAKAKDICMLDVRKICDFADYMVIVSATSGRHAQSIANKVEEHLSREGRKPLGVEGTRVAEWILVDFGDIVVHVMQSKVRDFYNLEKLWSDGKKVKLAGRT